ncbi:MAG: metal/formaldehyde-sensitive transcriptional repressor [Achromobacter pulmonis]|uniref:Transcriptional repressor RcnR n=1 Tax=Achromobacter pulmonis TaxID=1389932 RepID=A0A6S7CI27_9BURK|nr:metal/formaldehyde-sensitive transcriptional repressor [Achromobacter pulmonis]MCF7768531.1 metal/formaldehyde-sensitive transcriptional repressor [Achromobacter pulmonis]MPT26098.1 metal/formaldehyde-sensitive transcriptional repressor [Achromobacter sp.]CAB3633791.1 Transcriptional repressor RcnR [Achromobacter pulmonis]CAB3846753.1 Transcriptional repressor RcnR [Achromobacter pulmonis]
MAHTIRQKEKLIARVRRIRGQLDGIERALEAEAACGEVLRQLASARGALSGLTAEVMQGHLDEHVVHAPSEAGRAQAAQEMMDVIRAYMK